MELIRSSENRMRYLRLSGSMSGDRNQTKPNRIEAAERKPSPKATGEANTTAPVLDSTSLTYVPAPTGLLAVAGSGCL